MRIEYNRGKSTGIYSAGRCGQFLCLAWYVSGGGAAFQPTLGFGIGNFSVTAWGSTNFSGGNKELDLTLAYKLGEAGPTLTVADLWWEGEGAYKYFNFKSHETGHHFEAGLSYTLPVEVSFVRGMVYDVCRKRQETE